MAERAWTGGGRTLRRAFFALRFQKEGRVLPFAGVVAKLWAVPTGFLRVRLFEGGNGKAEAGKKFYFGIKFFRLLPLPRTVFFGDSYAPRLT